MPFDAEPRTEAVSAEAARGGATYRVTLAYDGTDFAGWQRQAGRPERTVQGELEAALERLSRGARVAVHGAGRTDAGVHALGQVASFRLPRSWPPAELARALNALLARDVRVLEAASAPADFHARRSALSKRYRYALDTGPVQLPTRRRYAAHLAFDPDREAMRAGAELFLGRRDFRSLASSGGSARTSVRNVTRSEVRFEPEGLVYEVEADGFLRKMVRSMVGGLLAAGRGACSVGELRQALEARDRRRWPAPAEARGLTLVAVAYAPAPPRRSAGGV
ncbi:MAG: tRNA pseudouridine(38-40) synthase TruA [Vicinamibacteria bacterium]